MQILALSVWFAAAAVAQSMQETWEVSPAAIGWLTASVQAGFVVGALTATLTQISDRLPAQMVLGCSALGASGSTLALALLVDDYPAAVALRFVTGVFLAGVYPVGMKLTASWALPRVRARAFGLLVACLTLGSALPHLIKASLPLPWRSVFIAAAILSAVAAVLSLVALRSGPLVDSRVTSDSASPFDTFRRRVPLLINLGYIGHMWELYAFWAWISAFLAAAPSLGQGDWGGSVDILAFVTIGVAGALGCLLGGIGADRWGKTRSAGVVLVLSVLLGASSPLWFAAPAGVLIAIVLLWGAIVIADSGMFSTALSVSLGGRGVGSALALQTAAGFLVTIISIQLVPLLADAVGWRYALVLLAAGPVIGAVAMRSAWKTSHL